MKLYQTSSTLMKLFSKIFFSLSYDKNMCSAKDFTMRKGFYNAPKNF